MNREEYIKAIKNELGFMPCGEVAKAEEYFRSFFACDKSDEEIISGLGTPKEAARRYCAGKGGASQERQPVKQRDYTGIIVAVVAAVFLFPIWLPILILSAIIVFGLLAAAVAVSFGMWLSGGVVILGGLFSGATAADKLIQCGGGFVMFGVGLILSWLVVWALIKLCVKIIRKVTRS